MMADRRRQIGTFAVVGLVLLRLAIGWHFYREGSSKLAYDPRVGQFADRFDVPFSAESFLSQAEGPLAGWFQSFAPRTHDWPNLLAVARQDAPPSDSDAAERAKRQAEYERRRADAVRDGNPPPIQFPPAAPYHNWARRIADDWQALLTNVKAIAGLTDEQRRQAADALVARQQQLADFLAGEAEAIADYQHELWRLKTMRAAPEADGAPFAQRRIANKAAQTGREPLVWVDQIKDFERAYVSDLRGIMTAEQLTSNATTTAAFDSALLTPQERRLRTISLTVAGLTVGVGICLLVGFFTRFAAVAGALFLTAVIAAQPPWVADAAPTYYQAVELAGLLVLAGTGAGRWAGLDFFGYALFSRCCRGGTKTRTKA